MKIAEDCFLEICNTIKNIKEHKIQQGIDQGEKIITSIINYSKLHNYESVYLYKGNIELNKDIKMNYYFSNKRSYISIDNSNNSLLDELDIVKYEYLLLKYIDKLFNTYKIDKFINSL